MWKAYCSHFLRHNTPLTAKSLQKKNTKKTLTFIQLNQKKQKVEVKAELESE